MRQPEKIRIAIIDRKKCLEIVRVWGFKRCPLKGREFVNVPPISLGMKTHSIVNKEGIFELLEWN